VDVLDVEVQFLFEDNWEEILDETEGTLVDEELVATMKLISFRGFFWSFEKGEMTCVEKE
jgi:hypothetical protein